MNSNKLSSTWASMLGKNHFEIPKLELLQSIVSSIMWSGALPQWSADITECLHIDLIKIPQDNTNNLNYYSQICCHLDHDEKHQHFDLAQTSMLQPTAIHPYSTGFLPSTKQPNLTGSLISITPMATIQTGSLNFPKLHKSMGHLNQ